MFFKSAKRLKKDVDKLRSSIRIDPIRPDPPSAFRKSAIERPLEESVEEYAQAHAALKRRKKEKRIVRLKRFIEAQE
ncbi:MAG: hypothetical protein IKS61_03045 [Aeriscardovia sp.]|nr:hypothetical protein [Aeriscardovia sp.]